MHRRLGIIVACLALIALSFAFVHVRPAAAQDESTLTSELDPAPIVEWMELVRARVHAETVNAPAASRLYAYAGITVYESLLPGMTQFRSLAYQVNGMPEMPYIDDADTYDWLSSANGALSTIMGGLIPTSDSRQAFNALRREQAAARAEDVGDAVVTRSLAFGDQVGKAILGWAKEDGYDDSRQRTADYTLPIAADFGLAEADDYLYVQTNDAIPLAEPYWGQIRTFAVYSPYECYVENQMIFSIDEESAFYQQAMEVFRVSNNLTPEQREIAEFWIDTPGISSTPAGHWVSIMNQMVDHLDLTLDRAAMMYGMVSIVLGDSFISAWSQKYETLVLRPETYINRQISRGWRSYLATPQFPEYPSGHSVVSAAASDMLTTLFGVVPFTDRTHERDTGVTRSFLSFEHAADEAAISRLYGGIHYRNAIENGKRMGRCITERTLNNIVMLPVAQGE
ncbi:MAG: vanadium-dependent haloperoxidase [Chloroflexota bacterium]|nr:vanadium-dependent haloperoxidase [Chloroflexota bacterium]